MDLKNPNNVNSLMSRAPMQEIPVILLKSLSQVDENRNKGKTLARNVLSRSAENLKVRFKTDDVWKQRDLHPENPGDYDNPWDPEEVYQARPVITRKQVKDYNHGQGILQYLEEGREFTRAELQTLSIDFSQKDLAHTEWLLHIWDKGANTIMLTGTNISYH
ncbi:hypothetical protein mRhiFer1_008389 [Rhinolophus ferrumequinum]|uniref:Uncharacterized protein n=1 Tax=Rhinolophus ferrumequinum TaxID=59479 RepID=A0A7J7VE52_RHIFE|nr:hypothetical protein mRhiFer1_008389 [Rhinolophus ferrumequinum]